MQNRKIDNANTFSPANSICNMHKQRGARESIEKIETPIGDENQKILLEYFLERPIEKIETPVGDEYKFALRQLDGFWYRK